MEEASCESSRSQPINSFLFSLRMRKEMKLMELLLCCPKKCIEWNENISAEGGQRHSIHHQSTPIPQINSISLIDVEWNGWLVRLIWRRKVELVCCSCCLRGYGRLAANAPQGRRERKQTTQPIKKENEMKFNQLERQFINGVDEWSGLVELNEVGHQRAEARRQANNSTNFSFSNKLRKVVVLAELFYLFSSSLLVEWATHHNPSINNEICWWLIGFVGCLLLFEIGWLWLGTSPLPRFHSAPWN